MARIATGPLSPGRGGLCRRDQSGQRSHGLGIRLGRRAIPLERACSTRACGVGSVGPAAVARCCGRGCSPAYSLLMCRFPVRHPRFGWLQNPSVCEPFGCLIGQFHSPGAAAYLVSDSWAEHRHPGPMRMSLSPSLVGVSRTPPYGRGGGRCFLRVLTGCWIAARPGLPVTSGGVAPAMPPREGPASDRVVRPSGQSGASPALVVICGAPASGRTRPRELLGFV
jgi:hypothetical protein